MHSLVLKMVLKYRLRNYFFKSLLPIKVFNEENISHIYSFLVVRCFAVALYDQLSMDHAVLEILSVILFMLKNYCYFDQYDFNFKNSDVKINID